MTQHTTDAVERVLDHRADQLPHQIVGLVRHLQRLHEQPVAVLDHVASVIDELRLREQFLARLDLDDLLVVLAVAVDTRLRHNALGAIFRTFDAVVETCPMGLAGILARHLLDVRPHAVCVFLSSVRVLQVARQSAPLLDDLAVCGPNRRLIGTWTNSNRANLARQRLTHVACVDAHLRQIIDHVLVARCRPDLHPHCQRTHHARRTVVGNRSGQPDSEHLGNFRCQLAVTRHEVLHRQVQFLDQRLVGKQHVEVRQVLAWRASVEPTSDSQARRHRRVQLVHDLHAEEPLATAHLHFHLLEIHAHELAAVLKNLRCLAKASSTREFAHQHIGYVASPTILHAFAERRQRLPHRAHSFVGDDERRVGKKRRDVVVLGVVWPHRRLKRQRRSFLRRRVLKVPIEQRTHVSVSLVDVGVQPVRANIALLYRQATRLVSQRLLGIQSSHPLIERRQSAFRWHVFQLPNVFIRQDRFCIWTLGQRSHVVSLITQPTNPLGYVRRHIHVSNNPDFVRVHVHWVLLGVLQVLRNKPTLNPPTRDHLGLRRQPLRIRRRSSDAPTFGVVATVEPHIALWHRRQRLGSLCLDRLARLITLDACGATIRIATVWPVQRLRRGVEMVDKLPLEIVVVDASTHRRCQPILNTQHGFAHVVGHKLVNRTEHRRQARHEHTGFFVGIDRAGARVAVDLVLDVVGHVFAPCTTAVSDFGVLTQNAVGHLAHVVHGDWPSLGQPVLHQHPELILASNRLQADARDPGVVGREAQHEFPNQLVVDARCVVQERCRIVIVDRRRQHTRQHLGRHATTTFVQRNRVQHALVCSEVEQRIANGSFVALPAATHSESSHRLGAALSVSHLECLDITAVVAPLEVACLGGRHLTHQDRLERLGELLARFDGVVVDATGNETTPRRRRTHQQRVGVVGNVEPRLLRSRHELGETTLTRHGAPQLHLRCALGQLRSRVAADPVHHPIDRFVQTQTATTSHIFARAQRHQHRLRREEILQVLGKVLHATRHRSRPLVPIQHPLDGPHDLRERTLLIQQRLLGRQRALADLGGTQLLHLVDHVAPRPVTTNVLTTHVLRNGAEAATQHEVDPLLTTGARDERKTQ